MDCETARLFLHFDRPGERDLDGREVDELYLHLLHCSACNSLALAARHLDQHLGRAMRAVQVPAGLEGRLLERLAGERRAAQRRRLGRVARVLAVAACLLLIVWAGFAYFNPNRKDVDAKTVFDQVNMGPYRQEGANEFFKRHAGAACAPDFVNYEYLLGAPAMGELPGYPNVEVPQLVFVHRNNQAFVLALDNRRFKVDQLQISTQGYNYKLVVYDEEKHFTYLILHNGSSETSWEDWLKVNPDGA
jgi:hypothetical protein